MKVVILHPPLYPVNNKLFNELGKYCDLHVICFGSNPRYHKDWPSSKFIKDDNKYKLIILEGDSAAYKLQLSPKYIKYIIKEKPEIVVSIAFWVPSLLSSILKYFIKFKFCIITDATINTDSNISKFKILLRKLIVFNTNKLIAGSKLTSQYLGTLTKKASKIEESLQTIDVIEWQSIYKSLPNKNELRAKLNYNSDDKILLSVGQLDDNKNIASLIKQFHKLSGYKLIIVGDGPGKKELKRLTLKLKLTDQINFIDRKTNSDLIEYYKISDIFILPSKSDTFGFVVSEALVSGLPVLCSKYAGASSLIKDGFNGYIINPKASYSDKIGLAFKNLSVLSTNALSCMSTYTLENKAIGLNEIFKSVLSIENEKDKKNSKKV
ncbi:glycosyltransferase [Winogradskyella sp. PE311]|uniref:glycosyltransferase n=1 Tax=Winogradskyella sp. PE311 TaxID=3366943 RepID=UPI00398134C3